MSEDHELSTRRDGKYAPLANSVKDALGQTHIKPGKTYLELISRAILESKEQRLVLHDIYEAIMEKYPYYRVQLHPGWKSSIRHCLSLNDCFVKNGRCPLGKGNYWAIHAACVADFRRGEFSRLNARRKSKGSKSRGSFHQVDVYSSTVAQPASQTTQWQPTSPTTQCLSAATTPRAEQFTGIPLDVSGHGGDSRYNPATGPGYNWNAYYGQMSPAACGSPEYYPGNLEYSNGHVSEYNSSWPAEQHAFDDACHPVSGYSSSEQHAFNDALHHGSRYSPLGAVGASYPQHF